MVTTLFVFCFIYAILCAFGVVSSLRRSSRRAREENDLQQQGIRITGQLAGRVSPNIAFTYLPIAYEYGGKTYKYRQWVSKHFADAFFAQASVDVLSLPYKPEIAMLTNISPGHWESRVLKRMALRRSILLCISILLLIFLFAINH